MRKNWIVFFLLIFGSNSIAQVRNGWRSIYDKEGRLTRMYYYDNGKSLVDSSCFFQYYTENALKALITGEIAPQTGKITGTMSLFDYSGQLTRYSIKKENYSLFEVSCDYDLNCSALWHDPFELNSENWLCQKCYVNNGDFIIQNDSIMAAAVFNPVFPVNLNQPFTCKVIIPVEKNTAKLGLAIGWKNEENFCMFEISFGKYYSIVYYKNGEYNTFTEGRQDIEKPNPLANELLIRNNGKNILLEINGVIEMVLPCHEFLGDQIALVTRSKGDARFSDFGITYQLQTNDQFFEKLWIGKGTGFFISPTKILTTYDVVMEAKKLRIIGRINEKTFYVPVQISQVEESNNLAVLSIDDPEFSGPDTLPYGFTDHVPISASAIFSLGYPNAVSGIYLSPDVYDGKVLPSSAAYSGIRLLEMPYRYGMNGSPVFDTDANLIGVCATRGIDLNYTDIVDFYDNSRLFKANMGVFDRKIVSPVKDASRADKLKVLSEIVVIIESSVFDVQ